ncbi:uncharacterized protein AMSG_01508 [Thecamonas trahens ATCC 50062]|uniref:Uncharacterized protein n=1 Tax=Thecamonas trahens ATCC 50062 TaxID=461836 RepID=A0A0L0DQU9_THETB|nr:hypothetical protein AMSG_01508 [Thecamonas trahens ATCC 50062]KNC54657.1 hypothetical protein AMSG_01508 [Thecamonas trahens ATCC 50062]|eukprot:XP_013761559.1 hypothetical protein AMSG_01508 [Thecamonas trahens ATCC 50062]
MSFTHKSVVSNSGAAFSSRSAWRKAHGLPATRRPPRKSPKPSSLSSSPLPSAGQNASPPRHPPGSVASPYTAGGSRSPLRAVGAAAAAAAAADAAAASSRSPVIKPSPKADAVALTLCDTLLRHVQPMSPLLPLMHSLGPHIVAQLAVLRTRLSPLEKDVWDEAVDDLVDVLNDPAFLVPSPPRTRFEAAALPLADDIVLDIDQAPPARKVSFSRRPPPAPLAALRRESPLRSSSSEPAMATSHARGKNQILQLEGRIMLQLNKIRAHERELLELRTLFEDIVNTESGLATRLSRDNSALSDRLMYLTAATQDKAAAAEEHVNELRTLEASRARLLAKIQHLEQRIGEKYAAELARRAAEDEYAHRAALDAANSSADHLFFWQRHERSVIDNL